MQSIAELDRNELLQKALQGIVIQLYIIAIIISDMTCCSMHCACVLLYQQ